MQPVRDRSKHNSRRKQQGIILTMCKLMNIYNRELNGLAKVNGSRLLRASVCRRVIAELNKSYDSVSYQTINSLLDSFVTKCLEKVKTWDNSHHCGDNVDKRIKARHGVEGKSYMDLHMYNNLLYKQRIYTPPDLSDIPPPVPELDDIDLSQFIPSVSEQKSMLDKMKQEIGKVWAGIDELNTQLKEFTSELTHSYSAEMAQKTEKVRISYILQNSYVCFISYVHPSLSRMRRTAFLNIEPEIVESSRVICVKL